MARINNSTLAATIRSLGGTPNGATWAAAKAVITPENEGDAAKVLAADPAFVAAVKVDVEAEAARKAARPAPAPGSLKAAIANYTPQAKTATFTKANGETIACTPKQKAAWEAGRSRFVAANAEREAAAPTAVTQELDASAVAKLLAENPQVLASALASLLQG